MNCNICKRVAHWFDDVRWTRSPSSRSGQMMVLFCWLMVMTTGFLAITMNLGGTFIYHAHLQTSADNSVFSGAVMQARGLNEIARINERIRRELRRSSDTVGRGIYSSFSAGNAAANRERSRFESLNRRLNNEQAGLNRSYARDATAAARYIANRNQSGLPAVEFTDFSHGQGRLTELQSTSGDIRNFSFRYYYFVWVRIGSGEDARWVRRRRTGYSSGPRVEAMMLEKGTDDHTYFSARLFQAAFPYPFTVSGMWPEVFENMRTYATAMPFGGILWDGRRSRAEYDVKLVRTGDVRPRPRIPDGWGYEW